MPVTFNVSTTIVPTSKAPDQRLNSHVQVFNDVWGSKGRNSYKEVLQSTFSSGNHVMSDMAIYSNNGFLDTVISAYNSHNNLVLRPDDIWIAILTQFNFYVNAHAEDLRSKFVAHEGTKKLIVRDVGTRYSVDFGKLAAVMTGLIQENVVDPNLRDWILPNFTTTTVNDTVVSSVLMMATLKSYFSYGMSLTCGIPNVTLMGVKEDWEDILNRIDKLETFGEEPTEWASLLRPILTQFINAFDGNHDVDFWARICHIERMGSGSDILSGWMTKFCAWNEKGRWIGPREHPHFEWQTVRRQTVHRLSMVSLPPAICEVDVSLDDNGEAFDCIMVAGHVGSVSLGEARDTLGMVPAWFIAIKDENPNS